MDLYQLIKEECLSIKSTNPIEIFNHIAKSEYISMHGPEHHVLDGACLLTALYHAGFNFNLSDALDEMIERGKAMPGGTCGRWGMCGSASSCGAALSILNQTSPISAEPHYSQNMNAVIMALKNISAIGGPRCCKRNAYLSLQASVDFVNQNYEHSLTKGSVQCEYSVYNSQCLLSKCPFYDHHRKLRVAFLCVHNSCRSQIAEAIGKHLANDVIECWSAGTEIKSEINPDAVRLVQKLYQIDMRKTQHPKLITEIPPVDIIITMGCNVECPSIPCKLHEDWGLEDPTGKSDDEFLKIIQQIENNILELKSRFN